MREMYILKEPRQKEGGKDKKTIWSKVGVMFRNPFEDGKDTFDLLFNAHPIGERVKAFRADDKSVKKGVTVS